MERTTRRLVYRHQTRSRLAIQECRPVGQGNVRSGLQRREAVQKRHLDILQGKQPTRRKAREISEDREPGQSGIRRTEEGQDHRGNIQIRKDVPSRSEIQTVMQRVFSFQKPKSQKKK